MKNIERLYIFQWTKTIQNKHCIWDLLHHLGTSIESSKLSPIVIVTCSTSSLFSPNIDNVHKWKSNPSMQPLA